VLAVTLVLQKVVFPSWNISSWVTQAPYNIVKTGVVGTMNNWALMIALVVGIVITLAINPTRIKGNLPKAMAFSILSNESRTNTLFLSKGSKSQLESWLLLPLFVLN